jgi:hypothetical protein
MNIELENKTEKKAYVAPAMEIMSMEQNINLLTGSEVEIEDFEGVKDWDGEFN